MKMHQGFYVVAVMSRITCGVQAFVVLVNKPGMVERPAIET